LTYDHPVRHRVSGAYAWLVTVGVASQSATSRADDAPQDAGSPPATAPSPSEPPPVLQPPPEQPQPPVEAVAPWLRPWLPKRPPDLDPTLAEGPEATLVTSVGPSISSFSIAPALSETGACGWFIASSTKQALSVEAIEKLNVVLDHTTPQFGMLGAGLRRVGRRSGKGFGSVDYERIALGAALTSRGSNLDAGIALELAFGFLTYKGGGLSLSLEAYAFDTGDLMGPDKAFVIGLGYAFSPMTGMRASPLVAAPAPEPRRLAKEPCADVGAYRSVLVIRRRAAVDVCNQGNSPACEGERAAVMSLVSRLDACLAGDDVGPPTEVHDAPAP
jgi:hypothetical protein